MKDSTAALARSITWGSSKQTYYTVRLLVDKEKVDDCYRAYAYFRWADDIVDDVSQSIHERISFIRQQSELVNRLYQNDRPDDLTPEEDLIADLVAHDDKEDSGLESFIRYFLAILEFDAHRKGRFISQDELRWYSDCLGKAVTDCIQYFIGNAHPYPVSKERYLAATAAHVTHMLRDMVLDAPAGFVNIPRRYLEVHDVSPQDVGNPQFRAWVRERVELARRYFHEGKRYLDELDVLRCKIAGYWYCARFEGILEIIERDGYILRSTYNERRKLSTWLKMAWLGVSVTLRHIAHRWRRAGLFPAKLTPRR